jgi:hypothetical protein
MVSNPGSPIGVDQARVTQDPSLAVTQNQNFGSALGRPDRVLQGRLVRLTAQIDF